MNIDVGMPSNFLCCPDPFHAPDLTMNASKIIYVWLYLGLRVVHLVLIVTKHSFHFQRLVFNDFDINQPHTSKKEEYFPSLFVSGNLFEVIELSNLVRNYGKALVTSSSFLALFWQQNWPLKYNYCLNVTDLRLKREKYVWMLCLSDKAFSFNKDGFSSSEVSMYHWLDLIQFLPM